MEICPLDLLVGCLILAEVAVPILMLVLTRQKRPPSVPSAIAAGGRIGNQQAVVSGDDGEVAHFAET
ncbi:hypothetical protein CBOM_06270 [Ceraceosorus bombacis]|uniref:Uncharacterized protein n=1 Tax=Ceraceosorus bombacis TaxID=401625 RepID=A0A0P1A450_9BASI|nr:hypothetical protein CBOM_06270 [Ceraceosorus bombacis]